LQWSYKKFFNKHFWINFNFRGLDKEKLRNNLFFFGLVNLLWLIFRTGTKPSRITYPCQRSALNTVTFSTITVIPLSFSTPFISKKKNFLPKNGVVLLAILILGVMSGELFLKTLEPNPSQTLQLKIESKNASTLPASDIFVVNGNTTPKISDLISLMSLQDLNFFKSSNVGDHQGPEGLIASTDLILLKINSQWTERGGSNTDLLKDLIQTIVSHPDGFIGEIIIADNGQGYGGMNHAENNAENTSQSTQDVVDMFSSVHNVSTYNWADIRGIQVNEYSEGDLTDGYIIYDSADPETGIYVSYPKFQTEFGTNVSFKHGSWNGIRYDKRLKVINLPVLKSHFIYGVTGSLKNYMGVQSEVVNGGLANGHTSIATGGMGTLMAELGLPTLNIIDAVWVNANPYPDLYCGPSTDYSMATRVNMIIAGVDPIALDYWTAKYILVPTAKSIGYDDTHTLHPENTKRSGLTEAFGVWLDLTKDEMLLSNCNVTIDENRMNIIANSSSFSFGSSNAQTSGFEVTFLSIVCFSLVFFTFLRKRRRAL
jgi:hypothetical protein